MYRLLNLLSPNKRFLFVIKKDITKFIICIEDEVMNTKNLGIEISKFVTLKMLENIFERLKVRNQLTNLLLN